MAQVDSTCENVHSPPEVCQDPQKLKGLICEGKIELNPNPENLPFNPLGYMMEKGAKNCMVVLIAAGANRQTLVYSRHRFLRRSDSNDILKLINQLDRDEALQQLWEAYANKTDFSDGLVDVNFLSYCQTGRYSNPPEYAGYSSYLSKVSKLIDKLNQQQQSLHDLCTIKEKDANSMNPSLRRIIKIFLTFYENGANYLKDKRNEQLSNFKSLSAWVGQKHKNELNWKTLFSIKK